MLMLLYSKAIFSNYLQSIFTVNKQKFSGSKPKLHPSMQLVDSSTINSEVQTDLSLQNHLNQSRIPNQS